MDLDLKSLMDVNHDTEKPSANTQSLPLRYPRTMCINLLSVPIFTEEVDNV